MKKNLLAMTFVITCFYSLQAQVTQINNNHSLNAVVALTSTKVIAVSKIDSTIWVTDASLAGTVQISTAVKYESFGAILSGKLIFRGSMPTTGSELYITDGTAGGTMLVSDISPGATGSAPNDFCAFNGFVYFSATRAAEGRELWRTDGMPGGTTLVKDIVPGADSSNSEGHYHLISGGTYLLFAANNASTGVELWTSDGTTGGTVLLKDINPGADSSNPSDFYLLNNAFLFTATDAIHGKEIWKTNGMSAGTTMLTDINPGTGSFTSIPGFSDSIFGGFHTFNNHAFFQANDGTSTGELWSTDGTNTILVKNIIPGTGHSFISFTDAVNLSNKFIFPVSDGSIGTRSELWESNGTPAGTILFKSFPPVVVGDIPEIFVPDYPLAALFQGNKFFFAARTPAQGYELWVSDGTLAGTNVVKDINPGIGDGIEITGHKAYSYSYQLAPPPSTDILESSFLFAANDGIHGNELWKIDITDASTLMVRDINPNANDADPDFSVLVLNGKVLFGATDGDDPAARDLFIFDAAFVLPVKLVSFTASREGNINKLEWITASEQNSDRFQIQRSNDGIHFAQIGEVKGAGNSNITRNYRFNDAHPLEEINYYRLRIVDIDNTVTYSQVVSVRNIGSVNFTIYPNPAKNTLVVNMDAEKAEMANVTVTDVNGRKVYNQQVNIVRGKNSFPIEINNLSRGSYYIKIQLSNSSLTNKFNKLE